MVLKGMNTIFKMVIEMVVESMQNKHYIVSCNVPSADIGNWSSGIVGYNYVGKVTYCGNADGYR